jgi:hypothetical protein
MTLFCVVGFGVFAVSFKPYFTVVVPAAKESQGEAIATYLVANWLLTVVSFVGYWRMAKWGVWLYGTLFLLGIAVGIANSYPNTARSILGPCGILAIGIVYYRRMRWRLEEWRLSRNEFPWRATGFYLAAIATPISVSLLAYGGDVLPSIPARLPVLIAPPFLIAFLVAAVQFLVGYDFKRRYFGVLSVLEVLIGLLWIGFACTGIAIAFSGIPISAE